MVLPAAVTVVVNGAVVSSSVPPLVAAGRVVVPLRPIVVRLTTRATYDPATGAVEVERGAARLRLVVAFVDDGVPYVELAPLVRAFGGSVSFDSPTKTLNVTLRADDAIATPVPYDAALPRVSPAAVFTPAAPPSTPRAPDSGVPRPRRTAIPAQPSQPEPPSAAPVPQATGPRR